MPRFTTVPLGNHHPCSPINRILCFLVSVLPIPREEKNSTLQIYNADSNLVSSARVFLSNPPNVKLIRIYKDVRRKKNKNHYSHLNFQFQLSMLTTLFPNFSWLDLKIKIIQLSIVNLPINSKKQFLYHCTFSNQMRYKGKQKILDINKKQE